MPGRGSQQQELMCVLEGSPARREKLRRNYGRSTGKKIFHTRNGEVRANKVELQQAHVSQQPRKGVCHDINSYVKIYGRAILTEGGEVKMAMCRPPQSLWK